MVMVGPRLQYGNDRAAVGVSIGGVGVGRDYPHFGDGVGRGVVCDEVILRLVVFGAFDGVVVLLFAVAIDRRHAAVEGVPLDSIVSGHAGWIGVDGAGLEKRERGEVGAIQREVRDLVGGERVSQSRVAGVKDGMKIRLH